MPATATTLTIGPLATAAGVSVETIRFYQRRGLLSEPHRPLRGFRRYGNAELARVRFIKAAQRLGFTLEEIAELLKLEDATDCGEARVLAERRLRDVRERLANLRRVETALSQVVARCGAARSTTRCPLIESLWQA